MQNLEKFDLLAQKKKTCQTAAKHWKKVQKRSEDKLELSDAESEEFAPPSSLPSTSQETASVEDVVEINQGKSLNKVISDSEDDSTVEVHGDILDLHKMVKNREEQDFQ